MTLLSFAKSDWFLTAIDKQEPKFLWKLHLFQSVIQRDGFRSLGEDEEVEFKAEMSDKGLEATEVRGVGGGDCAGSHRRPGAKKKVKKVR